MPRYVYRCPIHGEQERTLRIAERNSTQRCYETVVVERCQNWSNHTFCMREMERVPTTAAVHFKGSGFYETDYKRKT